MNRVVRGRVVKHRRETVDGWWYVRGDDRSLTRVVGPGIPDEAKEGDRIVIEYAGTYPYGTWRMKPGSLLTPVRRW